MGESDFTHLSAGKEKRKEEERAMGRKRACVDPPSIASGRPTERSRIKRRKNKGMNRIGSASPCLHLLVANADADKIEFNPLDLSLKLCSASTSGDSW